MEQYLFLCQQGRIRSPTAVWVARRIAQERGKNINMDYYALSYLSNENVKYIKNSQKIFVMEKYMKDKLVDLGVNKEKIFCLDILDEFKIDDSESMKILTNRLEEKLTNLI